METLVRIPLAAEIENAPHSGDDAVMIDGVVAGASPAAEAPKSAASV